MVVVVVVMTKEQEPVDVTEQLHELLRGIDFAFQKADEPNTPKKEQERYAAALAVIGRFFRKFIRSTRTVSSISAMHSLI